MSSPEAVRAARNGNATESATAGLAGAALGVKESSQFAGNSLPPQARIKLLAAQGALFRLGLIESRSTVAAHLQPRVLVSDAASHAVQAGISFAQQLFSRDGITSGRLAMALPLAGKVLGFLGRRKLLVPALALTATAGIIAGIVSASRRKARQQADAPAGQEDAGDSEYDAHT